MFYTVFIHLLRHTLKRVSKGAKIRNRYNQVPHLTQVFDPEVQRAWHMLFYLQSVIQSFRRIYELIAYLK